MTKKPHEYRTFVPAADPTAPPLASPAPPTVYMPQPIQHAPSREQGSSQRQKETSSATPITRAQAFVIRTRQISLMTAAAVGAIYFLIRGALPMATGSQAAGLAVVGAMSMLAGMGSFLIIWFAAYAVDMATSPGGVDFFEAWQTQKRINRESKAMEDAFRLNTGTDTESQRRRRIEAKQ